MDRLHACARRPSAAGSTGGWRRLAAVPCSWTGGDGSSCGCGTSPRCWASVQGRLLAQWLLQVSARLGNGGNVSFPFSLNSACPTVTSTDASLLARSSATLRSSTIQLAYLASLCAAARATGAAPAVISSIRELLPTHSEADFEESERSLLLLALEDRPTAASADASEEAAPTETTMSALPSVLADSDTAAPFGPAVAENAAAAPFLRLNVLTSTTPLALAGHLICLLPPEWVGRVVQQAIEALFVATLVSG